MSRAECAGDLLRWLAHMPLLDRLELAAVSGWSRGAVYEGITTLEDAFLVEAIPHASASVPPTRRYLLTARGLRRLSCQESVGLEALVRSRPVSARWRRILLERLDAVAVIHRLAAAAANASGSVRFRWYRASPLDAALRLPGGRTIGVVRLGPTAERTAFAKRLWRLARGPVPDAVLVLAPDEVRLRHTRRLLEALPLPALLAVERDAALADADSRVWRAVPGGGAVSMRRVIARLGGGGALPAEPAPSRNDLPDDIGIDPLRPPGPAWLLPALLRPAEKRVLDVVGDWPWIGEDVLRRLMGVSGKRMRRLLAMAEGFGLAQPLPVGGRPRWVLTGRGQALLARRDRASVGAARKRWSVEPVHPGAPPDWRNVPGARSRQLLRNIEHTSAVHRFIGALAAQARSRGSEVVQLDPPHRASRFFRYGGSLHSVRPDAFGIVRTGGRRQPFFLEWERRAVRPVTMVARLTPYLRYFATRRPTSDHGIQPIVLVVFDEPLSATQFLRVARREMVAAGVRVPLWVSDRETLAEAGPLGRAWTAPGRWEGERVFS